MSAFGLDESSPAACQTRLIHACCQQVVTRRGPLLIKDARAHSLVHNDFGNCDSNVVAYLGIPLISTDGNVVGSLCVIDIIPRAWSDDDVVAMTDLAMLVMTEAEQQMRIAEIDGRHPDQSHRNHVFAMMSDDVPLHDIFVSLCGVIEGDVPDAMASVLLLDAANGCLRHGAAPQLPEAYWRAMDAIAIGPSVGSCGTAAFLRTTVVVRDIATDPLWSTFRDVALVHGLRSCWSVPVIASDGQTVLGTIAVYRTIPSSPSDAELSSLTRASHIARIAIERKRAHDALKESEARFYSAFEDAATGQALVGFNGQFLRVNRSLCDMVGYAADDLIAMNYRAITHPDDIDLSDAVLEGNLPSITFEKRYIHKTGRVIWVQVTSTVVHDDDGQPLYHITQTLDITARRHAETSLI